MMQKTKRWIAVLLLAALLIPSAVPALAEESGSVTTEKAEGDYVLQETTEEFPNYAKYLHQYEGAARPEAEVAVDVTQFRLEQPVDGDSDTSNDVISATNVYQNLEGSETGLNIDAKGEKVIFTVDVPKTGLYCVEMKYRPVDEENKSQISFGFYIDGELPFIEADSCLLDRVFKNDAVKQDQYGDDLRPQSNQLLQWRTQMLREQTGVYGMLQFYLEAGSHEIALSFEGCPILLEKMTLKQEDYVVSYQDYISLYKQKGYTDVKDVLKVFQAENYYEQSSSTLWPDYDHSSSKTQPYSYRNNKINYGGGSQWKEPGQWITWEIDVPADGFYNIGCKYKQGYLGGLFSSRRIYIDGVVPFEELNAVRFDYTTQWKNKLLSGQNGPYSIFLTKGKHYITMENVVGDMSQTMAVLRETIDELNALYLSIIMITSSEPDKYRDYYLEKQLPNLHDDLMVLSNRLSAEAKRMEQIVGKKGAENAYLEDVAYNLKSYAENIVDLTYKDRITNMKNDISGLSSKLGEYQRQALDFDYIALVSSNMEMERPTMNFWEWLVYQIRCFFASFFTDRYKNVKEDDVITVWMNTGMDQFQILQNMITDDFTPKTGIKVNLKLVQGSLIEAKVSGNGPDIQIGADSNTVVNLGLRGALEDLSQYEGYDKVMEEHMPGSDIPFMLDGKHFGLPNSCPFSVMFVRQDIFDSMNLKVPETWDDVYDVAQVLQRYNMSLGCAASFENLLYQKGGSFYNENLTEVMFTESVAVDALKQHGEFYTKYGFPITFDFVSRFRTGEMPIALATYNTYNTLKYSAPEISGLWKMYPMPGTRQENGEINYTQVDSALTGVIMLESANRKDDCWEFIKWWCSSEAQTRYSLDVEASLGIAARATPANLKTMEQLAWTREELAVLQKQSSYLEFLPIVPGYYYVTRGLQNAKRGVIYDNENPRELLTEWNTKINDELLRKRLEFQNYN